MPSSAACVATRWLAGMSALAAYAAGWAATGWSNNPTANIECRMRRTMSLSTPIGTAPDATAVVSGAP